MNKDIRSPQHVLHVFDPNKKHRPHDEVEFIEGRYLDIVTTKNKDPHTLYFGTSKSSLMLTGIFLGDYELTSKVKDVSLCSENGIVTLSVKYVNEETGKLSSIKTLLPSQKLLEEVKKLLLDFDTNFLESVNSSFNDVYSQLEIIDASIVDINDHLSVLDSSVEDVTEHTDQLDSSIVDINDHLSVLDSSFAGINEHFDDLDSSIDNISERTDQIDASLNELVLDVENGKYNYTIHKDSGTYENGFKLTFTLFKGDEKQTDSSCIEITDMVLKELNYIVETNTIEAKIWPEPIETIDLVLNVMTLSDGTVISDVTNKLDSSLIKSVSLNLENYDAHINEFMNTDSSINDRLTIVEEQLKWETLK